MDNCKKSDSPLLRKLFKPQMRKQPIQRNTTAQDIELFNDRVLTNLPL